MYYKFKEEGPTKNSTKGWKLGIIKKVFSFVMGHSVRRVFQSYGTTTAKALPLVAFNLASHSDLKDRPSVTKVQILLPQAIKGFKGYHQHLELCLEVAYSYKKSLHLSVYSVIMASPTVEIPINLSPLQNFSQVGKLLLKQFKLVVLKGPHLSFCLSVISSWKSWLFFFQKRGWMISLLYYK